MWGIILGLGYGFSCLNTVVGTCMIYNYTCTVCVEYCVQLCGAVIRVVYVVVLEESNGKCIRLLLNLLYMISDGI